MEETKARRSIQAFNGFVAKLVSIVGVLFATRVDVGELRERVRIVRPTHSFFREWPGLGVQELAIESFTSDVFVFSGT